MGLALAPIQDTPGVYTNTPGLQFVRADGTQSTFKIKYDAVVDPTTGDDSTLGYSVGSRWIRSSTGKVFECTDASPGAAVWVDLVSGGGGGVPTSRQIITTSPLTGGGDLSADRTLGIAGLVNVGIAGDMIRSNGATWEYRTPPEVLGDIGAAPLVHLHSHSLLLDLNADDHAQYLNINGRPSGQVVFASTTVGGNLTLNSTAGGTGEIRICHTGGEIWFGRNASTAVKTKWFEITGSGNHSTSLEAQPQAADISYTWPAAGPTVNGQVLTSTTAGIWTWTTPSSGGTPGGANREVQFNNSGVFDGNPAIVIDDTNGRLGVGDPVGLAALELRFTVAVISDLSGILLDGAVNTASGQPQILIRKSRGDFTTRAPAFSGDNLGRIAWHGFADDTPDAFKPACEIMTMGLTNPTAGQPYFPTSMTFKVGTYNGVGYITGLSISGGNNVFVDQPRVIVGNGTAAGNAAFEVSMTSTNEAATHWHNASGDMWFGINGSGNIVLTKAGFSVASSKLMITNTQIFFNQGTNNYGFFGEVVVEGDGTGVLFEICREGTPGTDIVMAFSDWSTNKHIEIYSNGGALWNKQNLNADFAINGDNANDVFYMDASADACGFGTNAPTNKVDINADAIRIRGTRSPASNAAGNAGEVCFDGSFGYRCIASGNWARWAITTGY